MKSLLLVAALLSSTAGAAFAELPSSPGLPENFILGADGQYYFYPNAGKLRAAAGQVPGTVIVPDAAGRELNPRAPGGPQRVGRALTNTDAPLAVLGLPFDGEGILLDLANPFSGNGFGSRGSVGRGLVPYGAGQQAGAPDQFLQQASAPGRWLTDTADGVGTLAVTTVGAGAAFGVASAAAEYSAVASAAAGALGAASEFLVPAGIAATLAGGLVAGIDALNPWSGGGAGSPGVVGRSLSPVPMMSPDPIVILDNLNPWSGGGVGSPGVVGRGIVSVPPAWVPNGGNQMVAVPGRWLTGTAEGITSQVGALGTYEGGMYLAATEAAAGLGLEVAGLGAMAGAAGTFVVDLLNPWSGDGVGSRGAAGRSLSPVPMMSPDPIVILDTLNPWSGGGVGSPGVVGRGIMVPNGGNQLVAVPGRWLTETGDGIATWAETVGLGAASGGATVAGVINGSLLGGPENGNAKVSHGSGVIISLRAT